jgi:broad specificity phosphatase PhoE
VTTLVALRAAQSPLSPAGAAAARRRAAELVAAHRGAALWSSDAVQALDTAAPIATLAGLPVRSVAVLREAGASLDTGPRDEPEDEVQARAVAFAAQLSEGAGAEPGPVHFAVTHAAFLESLVNTLLSMPRTTRLAVADGDHHIVPSPWARLAPLPCGPAWRPATIRVSTADGDYVVRRDERPLDDDAVARLALARDVAHRAGCPDPALAAAPWWRDGEPCATVVVRRFVPGTHRLGTLGSAEGEQLLRLLARVHAALGEVPAATRAAAPPLLARVEHHARQGGGEGAAALRGTLTDSRVRDLLRRDEALADLDMHRDNALFARGSVTKIDFGALCRGPERLSAACAVTTGFLLYQDADPLHCLDVLDPTTSWDEHALAELRVLMRVRALLGLAWFERLAARGSAAAADAESHLDRYRRCLGRVSAALLHVDRQRR